MPSVNILDTLTAYIRDTDTRNRMDADTLGWKIAEHLTELGRPVPPAAASSYVWAINADKQMSAPALAKAVINRFAITH